MTSNTAEQAVEAATLDDCLAIGSIVNSNNHMDYTVEIYNEHDRERAPEPHERGFGQPVFIRQSIEGTSYAVMGVIYDTTLVNPDQGRSGPRLAPPEQDRFTPGYVEECTTLAGVALLGTAQINADDMIHDPSHRMPRWTLSIDDTVYQCPDGVTQAFHTTSDGDFQMAYVDRLIDIAGMLGTEVTVALIARLRETLADDDTTHRVLDVIERNVRWQASTDRGVVQ
jgi:hypothetical protein